MSSTAVLRHPRVVGEIFSAEATVAADITNTEGNKMNKEAGAVDAVKALRIFLESVLSVTAKLVGEKVMMLGTQLARTTVD